MGEYIEREALLAEYDHQHTGEPGRARKLIEGAPAADVALVRHGRWIKAEQYVDEDGIHTQVRCSLCGRYEDEREPYCNCGARMDGE